MDLLKASGNFILWIIMVAEVQGGPASDPRGYRWSEWQSCTSGCDSPNMRFRVCVYQNNNGQSECTPDEMESEIDQTATLATAISDTTTAADEITTTTDNLPTAEITTTDNLPTAEITTTDSLPAVEITTTDNSPTADTTTTDNLPASDTTTTDNLPASDTNTTDNLPAADTTTTDNLPTAEITTTDNLPGVSSTTIIDSSSTAINATAIYDSTYPNTNCSCVCNTVFTWSAGALNLTNEEAKQLITELRKQLAVNVSTLSSTMRKKISAPDKRLSSAAMGYLGTAVLVTIAIFIVGGDLVVLIAKLRS